MKFFLIAGEPSGDRLGAALIQGFDKRLSCPADFIGVGGTNMMEMGFESLFPMEEISIMGVGEILSRYFFLKKRIAQTAQSVLDSKPNALITIDLPEFNLRVADIVRKHSDIPIIHYVAPTVWAWRPNRAVKMAKFVDHVLALFPFEPPLMQAVGMGCDFVGHPVAQMPQAAPEDCSAYRAGLGVGAGDPLLLMLPGSRRGEIVRLGPRFGHVARGFLQAHPRAHLVLPAAPAIADDVAQMMANWDLGPRAHLLDPRAAGADYPYQKSCAFGAADLALAASGTVSLELAAAKTPMVIAYDMAPLSRVLMRWMLKIDTVTLVNLISETRHIPEFLGKAFEPAPVLAALKRLVSDQTARNDQIQAAEVSMARLGAGDRDPKARAAEAVLRVLGKEIVG